MTTPCEEIDIKFGELQRLRESLEKDKKIWKSGWLTFAGISDIATKYRKLKETLDKISESVWDALSALITCDVDEFHLIVKKLTVQDVDQLIDLLRQLGTVEGKPHPNLEQVLAELKIVINDLKTKPLTKGQVTKLITAIKKSLWAAIPFLPKLAKAIKEKFGDKIGDKVKGKAGQVAIKAAIKYALVLLIFELLKKAGKELPKGSKPLIGAVLTLIEFGYTMNLLNNINKIIEAINKTTSELICAACECGYQWPDRDINFIWVTNPFKSKKVTFIAEVFVQCFKKDASGKITVDKPCRAKFIDPDDNTVKPVLTKTFTKADIEQGIDSVYFKINKDSANNCLTPDAYKCFTYVKLSVMWENPKAYSTKNVLIGAKC